MKVFVGTSGWYYDWNTELSLDWYVENSRLNAIELNASFYRFPFPNQVRFWSKKGKCLHWVTKVNCLITHRFKFSEKSYKTWQKFQRLFSPLEPLIDYYLFQLPPNFSTEKIEKLERFIKLSNVSEKFALEPRNESWFTKKIIDWAKRLGITWVAIDSPQFSREIYKTTKNIYLRMLGRTDWYRHNYSKRELAEIARRIIRKKPKHIYIFFNNNHHMLENAQQMREILKTKKYNASKSSSTIF